MTTLAEWDRLIVRSQATTAFLQAERTQEKIRLLKEAAFPDKKQIEELEKDFDNYRRQHRGLCAQVDAVPNI